MEIQWKSRKNYDGRGPPPSAVHGYLTQLGGIITFNASRFRRGHEEVIDAQRLRERSRRYNQRGYSADNAKSSGSKSKATRPFLHPEYRCRPEYHGLHYRILGFLTRRRSYTERGLRMAEDAARERYRERHRRQRRLADEGLAIRMGALTPHRPKRRDSRRQYAPLHRSDYNNGLYYRENKGRHHHAYNDGRRHVRDAHKHRRSSSRARAPAITPDASLDFAPPVPPKAGYVPYSTAPESVSYSRSSLAIPARPIDGLPPVPPPTSLQGYIPPPSLYRGDYVLDPDQRFRSTDVRREKYNGSPFPPPAMRVGTHSTRTSRRSSPFVDTGIIPVEPSIDSHPTYGGTYGSGHRHNGTRTGGQNYADVVPVLKSSVSGRRSYR